MTVLSETRERFLLVIAANIPPARIAEIHFFQPIKQGGVESGIAVVAVWPEAIEGVEHDGSRHTIYTARYRLTLKGIDRGKWEASVVAEADAPLVTVDAVVRGVQHRSGDVDDPTRMEGDDARALLQAKGVYTPAPVIDAAIEPVVDATTEPIVDAPTEPIVDAPTEPVVDASRITV